MIGDGQVAGPETSCTGAGITGIVHDFHQIKTVGCIENGDSHGLAGAHHYGFLDVHIAVLSGNGNGLAAGGNPAVLADF